MFCAHAQKDVDVADDTPQRRRARSTLDIPPGTELPLELGTKVHCRWRGKDEFYQARVIEKRPGAKGTGDEDYEYYVHYEQFNRRMDS